MGRAGNGSRSVSMASRAATGAPERPAQVSLAEEGERAQLIALGRKLGLAPRELKELLAIYDAGTSTNRAFSEFVSLLMRYQRFVQWRRHGAMPVDSAELREFNASAGYLYMFA